VPDEAVTSALELAWLVARIASQARPPAPIPNALRPVVRFAKLPPTALATVRRVLDEDEEFREQVKLVAANERDIGRPSWLYLHRPPGWAEEIATSVTEAADKNAVKEAARADRVAQRRAEKLEAALRRSDEAAAEAKEHSTQIERELVEERRARRLAEKEAASLERRVHSLEGERDSARRRAAAADQLAGTVEELECRLTVAEEARSDMAAVVDELRAALTEAREDASSSAAATASARAEAVEAVTDAAMAGTRMREALARVSRALGSEVSVDEVGKSSDSLHAEPAQASRARARQQARRPLPLPPAVFDDSPQAAEFLVRAAGVMVLVDGYNATLAAWSRLPIAAQRSRLIDAASELAARTGADVHVVFDGADVPDAVPPSGRRAVRWSFSPAGVEADDVLLEMVEGFDPARPLVVASSDRRVRDGVRALGANAISTPQLFAVLRRDLL
jgi:predicted RNA-binding protein with PIN domain